MVEPQASSVTNDNQVGSSIEDEKTNECPSASQVLKAFISLFHLLQALILILGTSKMVHENTRKGMLPETRESITGPTLTPMCVEFEGKMAQTNPPVCPENAARARKTNEISKARCESYILLTIQSVSVRAVV